MKKIKMLSKFGFVMVLCLFLNVLGIINIGNEHTGDQINVDYPIEEEFFYGV